MYNELQSLGQYTRNVFRYWWVALVEAVLVLTDFVERLRGTWLLPPLWVKVAIGLAVLVVAQYLAYRENRNKAEADFARAKESSSGSVRPKRRQETGSEAHTRSASRKRAESGTGTLDASQEVLNLDQSLVEQSPDRISDGIKARKAKRDIKKCHPFDGQTLTTTE
jgi:hypothetical protein